MKKPKKLIWQIFPSYLLITVLSVAAVSWYASKSLHQFYQEQTAADLLSRATLLSELVVDYLKPVDTASADAVCKTVGKTTATRFTVILPSGVVIGTRSKRQARWITMSIGLR